MTNKNNAFKNLNIYWLGSLGLAVWFLFIHAPTFIIKRKVFFHDVPLAIHLIGAYTIYLACVHNALITPSISKIYHITIGRIGMIAGIISLLFGIYCSWWPTRWELVSRSFAIAITIGGFGQLIAQIVGYTSIRRYQSLSYQIEIKEQQQEHEKMSVVEKENDHEVLSLTELKEQQRKALQLHIGTMIGLFVCACGIPAAIRLVEGIVPAEKYFVFGLVITIIMLNIQAALYEKSFTNKMNNNNNNMTTTTTSTTNNETVMVNSQTPLMAK